MNQLQPHLRVNVIEGNRLLFGDAEMRLLDAIAREGTLTDGAAALGLSYRVAWGKLRAVEASLGARLLETTVGGSGGGSSRLTPAAQRIVAQYNGFRDAVGMYAIEQFEKHFGESASCSKLGLDDSALKTGDTPDPAEGRIGDMSANARRLQATPDSAGTDSEQPEIPAALLREAVSVSEPSGELV